MTAGLKVRIANRVLVEKEKVAGELRLMKFIEEGVNNSVLSDGFVASPTVRCADLVLYWFHC